LYRVANDFFFFVHQRNTEELGSYQKKIIKIDSHLGVALAGLAPDARILSNFLRQQSMSSKLVYNRPLAVSKAVYSIADKAQTNTQQYGRRPYGVGLIIIGHDETGPHLYEFLPSGSVLEYVGTAIGARSQAARTYLERSFEEFPEASLEELVVHGLNALRDTLAQDKELTLKNTSIAYVGKDTPFTLLDEDLVVPWLDRLDSVSRSTGGNAPATAADDAATEEAPSAEANAATEASETPANQDSMDTTE
jgi:20S proteasome subunit alpha 6